MELFIGMNGMTGLGYPIWRAARNMVIDMSTVSVKMTNAGDGIEFVDGAFVSSSNSEVEVYSVSGMKMRNSNLGAGTYIVVADGKAKKMSVR